MLIKTSKKLSTSKTGQTLTEYLILTALVGVGSIAVVQILGSNLQMGIGKVADAIRGKKNTNKGSALKEEHYSIKDLGDFNSALTDTEKN